MKKQQLAKWIGIVALLGASAVVIALYLRPKTVPTEPADGGAVAMPGEARKGKETSEAQLARLVPIAAAQANLTPAETTQAMQIMRARVTATDALPKVRHEDAFDGGSGVPTMQKGMEADRVCREDLRTILGREKGMKFYDAYFRALVGKGRPEPSAPVDR